MDNSRKQLERVRKRLGESEFRRVVSALENLSAYHDMDDRRNVEFVDEAEPPEIGAILELIDGLYNPFSTSRGAFSTTDDVLLALQREYNMKRGYELSLSNREYNSKTRSIINTINHDNTKDNALRFIKRRKDGKVRYRHPASSISISETTFFELKNELEEKYDVSPEVIDSYLSFVPNETTVQKQLSSFQRDWSRLGIV